MRIGRIAVALALMTAIGQARAQVVSPLTGSTANPESAAPPAPAATSPDATAPARPARATRPRQSFAERFAAANTTHDGKLTLEQAKAGHMRSVVRDFDKIDKQKRGYVTVEDIRAYRAERRASRAHAAKPPSE